MPEQRNTSGGESAVAGPAQAPEPAPAGSAAAGKGSPAPLAAAANNNERFVRRSIADVFGLGRSLYQKSPAFVQAGVDNLVWLSRPVVTKVVTKVNPLAQGIVDRLDDGVDTVTSKLAIANTTAHNASEELKNAAANGVSLVSKQWHASVDAILVPLHPTLAANVYFAQAVEQFKHLFASVPAPAASAADAPTSGDEKDGAVAAAAPTFALFVERLKSALALLWDERLVPLSEAFFAAAEKRYRDGAKSADDALVSIKQHLGNVWNEQVVAIFQSRVGNPSLDVYHRALTKFVQLHDAQAAEIKSGAQFVAVMRASLGAVWNDKLQEPVLELYAAIQQRMAQNADSVRGIAANLNRQAVKQQYVSLSTALQVHFNAVLSSGYARAEALSHWTLRRIYRKGAGLVTAAVDGTVQRGLALSASTLDFILPRGEGEALIVASQLPQPQAQPQVPASAGAGADAKAAGPDASGVATSASANRLSLRVLRDRASQRVRARVTRAITATKKAVERSESVAADVSTRMSAFVGVDVYTESKEFLARTQQLLSSMQSFAADTAAQAERNQSAVKKLALQRVRTALTAVNDEFTKHTAAVSALLARLEVRTIPDVVVGRTRTAVKSAVDSIRARLSVAITKLQALAVKAQDMTDALLDAELAALPRDVLRLLSVLPTLLPASVQSALANASAAASSASASVQSKVRTLLARLKEAVSAILAYTAQHARKAIAKAKRAVSRSSPTSASASASVSASGSSSGGLLAVPSSSSLALTPSDSPTLTPARPQTPPPSADSAAASSAQPQAQAQAQQTPTPVKEIAAAYDAHVAALAQAATPPVAQSKRKNKGANKQAKANGKGAKGKPAATDANADDDAPGAGAADE